MRYVKSVTVALLVLQGVTLSYACASDGEDIAVLESTEEGASAWDVPETFKDELGRTWVRTSSNPVIFDDTPSKPPGGTQADLDLASMSLEEATEALRPLRLLGRYEYTLSNEDAREFAAKIQRIVNEQDHLPMASAAARSMDEAETGGAGEYISNSNELGGAGSLRIGKKVWGTDDRSDITFGSANWPFNMVGRMHGAGSCTAFKLVDHFTAVTSAHCVHDGSSWKTPQHITFGGQNTLPGGAGTNCYFTNIPSCWDGDSASCDYAVIGLRGSGAWCNANDYDVGHFGTKNIGSWVDDINGQVTGWPTEDLKSGWTVPVLATHWKNNDGWTIFTYPDRIFYTAEETGGQSGGPYWATWDGDNHQVMGINKGWHSFIYDTNQGRKMSSSLFNWLNDNGGF